MLPEKWIKYFVDERIKVIERLCKGEDLGKEDFLISFTRTTPVVITDGPAGLSGSVKMVGFVPKKEYIRELAMKAYNYAYVNRPNSMRETAYILLQEFYRKELMDLELIGGLEMGFKHSWENIKQTKKATLLFYTPPVISFEVRTIVEIHDSEKDPYRIYLNSIHDIFHWDGSKSNYPAYLFKIVEIYDNSAYRGGFGKKIYP